MEKFTGYNLWFDIIGYKTILKSQNQNYKDDLKNFLEDVSKTEFGLIERLNFGDKFNDYEIFFRSFSDNFLIGIKPKQDISEMNAFLSSLSLLSIILGATIKKGIIIRGSISYGTFDYNDNIVFGEKIVELYELESSFNDPKIYLSEDLKIVADKYGINYEKMSNPLSFYDCNSSLDAEDIKKGIIKWINLSLENRIDNKTYKKIEWIIDNFNDYFKSTNINIDKAILNRFIVE